MDNAKGEKGFKKRYIERPIKVLNVALERTSESVLTGVILYVKIQYAA